MFVIWKGGDGKACDGMKEKEKKKGKQGKENERRKQSKRKNDGERMKTAMIR